MVCLKSDEMVVPSGISGGRTGMQKMFRFALVALEGSGDAVVDICRHSPFRGSGSGPELLFPPQPLLEEESIL